jgi:hypothetical protein
MAGNSGRQTLDLIFGARALARFIFNDERRWKSVYPLREELGLFKLRGQICGRPDTIEQNIACREAASAAVAATSAPQGRAEHEATGAMT